MSIESEKDGRRPHGHAILVGTRRCEDGVLFRTGLLLP